MDRILQAPAKQPRDALLLHVLAYCGQRVGATARLQWKHIQGLGTRDCVIRFPPSKGDELHTVPVMKRELHDKLVLMRELTQPEPEDWLFPSRQAGYLDLNQITRIVEHACRWAQVSKPWTAHQFRRSLITNLLEAGQELTVVSKVVANHKSPQTTMLHYRSVPGATAKAAFSATPW
jgi:integrase